MLDVVVGFVVVVVVGRVVFFVVFVFEEDVFLKFVVFFVVFDV